MVLLFGISLFSFNRVRGAKGKNIILFGLQINIFFNIFKKKRSTVLKENLQSAIKAKNWEAEVIVDVNHGDLQSLKREGVNLFLIPEDIARYIDYSSVSKDECFKLTHDEYESGNIDRVVKYIEEN